MTTIVYDGKEYPLSSSMNLKQQADFIDWVATQFLLNVRRKVIETGLPQDDAIEILKAAYLRAPAFHMNSPEVRAAARTDEGSRRILWLDLREHVPMLTFEEFTAKGHELRSVEPDKKEPSDAESVSTS